MATLAGITQGQWSKFEKGIVPKTDVVGKVAKTLGVSIENILFGESFVEVPHEIAEAQERYAGQLLSEDEDYLLRTYRKLHLAEKEKVIEIAELYSGVKESRRHDGGGSGSRESNSN
jgi:transcriptional regulator with XRE-family HTH domain